MISAGGPAFTNSQGVPWTAAYINGDVQGNLTSVLRSNIGAETRAKIVMSTCFNLQMMHM
ncbi:MAG: manganese catalase family protein [Ferruginibacter sp.]